MVIISETKSESIIYNGSKYIRSEHKSNDINYIMWVEVIDKKENLIAITYDLKNWGAKDGTQIACPDIEKIYLNK